MSSPRTVKPIRLTLEQAQKALAAPRPGFAAQARMSPQPRRGEIPPPPPQHPAKEAGVLVLLYTEDDELYFVLTRRTETVAMHKGQVSLPGGAREGTERLDETARRETSEELGIDSTRIEILGAPLTPLYIPVSGFWVTAFVGFWNDKPLFDPEPEEVIELIQTPLAALLDESSIEEEVWEIRGERVRVPFFLIRGHKVWGATAMMLSEFGSMLHDQVAGQE
jgi:8-oxo-dGTP pyrophosphatase MutT (NUDIX family)